MIQNKIYQLGLKVKILTVINIEKNRQLRAGNVKKEKPGLWTLTWRPSKKTKKILRFKKPNSKRCLYLQRKKPYFLSLTMSKDRRSKIRTKRSLSSLRFAVSKTISYVNRKQVNDANDLEAVLDNSLARSQEYH